jgi:membrane protease YdiL (CAAX protease family)
MTPKTKSNAYFYLFLAGYFILFYAVWAAYTLLLRPVIFEAMGEETFLSSLLRNAVIKNLVWTLPAALLIAHFRSHCMVPLNKLFVTKKSDWVRFLPVFLFFALYALVRAWRTNGSLAISPSFGVDDVITVLFVGLTEEIVFRGWLLNATISDSDPPKRQYWIIGIHALLFLSIHFPIWIAQGTFVSSFTGLGFLCILVLSVVFSLAFLKTKNLWVPIGLHMFWDLLVFLFQQ